MTPRRSAAGPRLFAVLVLIALPLGRSPFACPLRTVALDNGLTVSICPDPSTRLVATEVWYHVGSAQEDSGSRGLAHLFEHLMFGATDDYDGEAFSRHHDRNGGYENAYTTPDETVYVSVIAPEHHDRVLEMEAQRMRGLRLSESDLEREKDVVAEELRLTTENDPLTRAYVTALAAMLGDHPYAVSPVGTKEEIAAATLGACRAFYDEHYQPGNAHLVISGRVDPERTLDVVRRRFGPIPAGGQAPPDVPVLTDWPFPGETLLEEDLPPVEIAVIGFALPPADSPDHAAALLLQQILAGSEIDPVREDLVTRRNKALEAGIEVLQLRRAGALLFYSAQLPYRRRATAFRLMDQTRQRLAELEWLTDETVSAARKRLLRREAARVFRADLRAESLGRAHWWYGDASAALDFARRIEAVERNEIVHVFRRFVLEVEPVRLYIKPERVPLYIRLFGWLAPLIS